MPLWHRGPHPRPSILLRSAHTRPQVPSVTAPSTHEYIQTVTTLNLVSTDISPLSPGSLLSTANLTTNIVRNEPKPYIPINKMGEISQTPAATLFASPHPATIPAVITPSVVPRPPSVSSEYPDDSRHSVTDYLGADVVSSPRQQHAAGYSDATC
jgi:hypothetical protein